MIEIRANTRPAVDLVARASAQLSFATSRAINQTLLDAQADIRQGIDLRFTIRSGRSRNFLHRQVLIRREDWATKQKLVGTIRADANRPEGKFNLLARFEAGGPRTARNPTFPFAIPTSEIRPTFQATVPRSLYPRNLGLVPRRSIKGPYTKLKGRVTRTGVQQLVGKRRTFVLDTRVGSTGWAVFQRFGPGKQDIRRLWTFKQAITIPPLLEFESTARATVARVWTDNFNAAFDAALRTAR